MSWTVDLADGTTDNVTGTMSIADGNLWFENNGEVVVYAAGWWKVCEKVQS